MARRSLTLAILVGGGLLWSGTAHAIVGGHAPSRSYPGMVQLEQRGDFICGASLVRSTWVLTAAHCVSDGENGGPTSPGDLTLVLGRTRRSDESTGERLRATRVIRHESYGTPNASSNDVALIELPRAARQAPYRVVTPAEADLWKPGTTATVTGWGGRVFTGIDGGSDDLEEIQVPIQSDSTCRQSYSVTLGYDAATMLCAGELTGGRDACQGDSGGPLTVLDGQTPVLVGVVSSGLGCAFPTQYGLYARIGAAALAGWIVRNAGPAPTPATPTAPGTSPGTPSAAPTPTSTAKRRKILGLKRAGRRGRALRLALVVRRPVTGLKVTVRRVRGKDVRTVKRTRRTRVTRNLTVAVRIPRTRRTGRLRIVVSGRDENGRRVGFARTLRTRG
ncbi:serine protease [Paraconexibacter sp.]|uniref:S1 family serine peptidase n=1 Tax=Paraconexibacter sp. TaxID=2949640 RepID=UPI003568ED7D